MILSCNRSTTLPAVKDISEAILRDPIQKPINGELFRFDYMERSYLVQPVRYYEIWGLVVSHNNIKSIADMYHDHTSVDLKDLCLIWGDNVADDTYHRAYYRSEPWTCFVDIPERSDYKRFNFSQFSNNHLLSHREEVREIIRKTRIGDQVHLRGMLVNYAPSEHPDHMRQSSLSRDDTGNGACEVMFVDSIEILRTTNDSWRSVESGSKLVALLSGGLIPVLFLLGVFTEQRELYGSLKKRKKR